MPSARWRRRLTKPAGQTTAVAALRFAGAVPVDATVPNTDKCMDSEIEVSLVEMKPATASHLAECAHNMPC
jgi:hypothetical protein